MQQEEVQGMAGVQLLEVKGIFLWPLSPVPAGRCPLLGARVWISLCAAEPGAGPVGCSPRVRTALCFSSNENFQGGFFFVEI